MNNTTKSLLILGLVLVGGYLIAELLHHPTSTGAQSPTTRSPLSQVGSIDASTYRITDSAQIQPDQIDAILLAYHSPTAGKGQSLYDLGQKYHISSDAALAFFGHESSFGTSGEARTSKSLGNVRCLGADYADLQSWCQDGYAWFKSWEQGFEAFYRLLRRLYVDGWNLTTLPAIIHRYAPSADNNDESAYVNELTLFLNAWYQGKVKP